MHLIISASVAKDSLCPLSKEIEKIYLPICGKQVFDYVLNEFYKKQLYITNIIIVKNEVTNLMDYFTYSKLDTIFKNKIQVVQSDYPEGLYNDFKAGMEYIFDEELTYEEKRKDEAVLLWGGNEVLINLHNIFDPEYPSSGFQEDGHDLDIFRFNDLEYAKKIIDKNTCETMQEFVAEFQKERYFCYKTNVGTYINWDSEATYYKIQAKFLELAFNRNHNLTIDTKRQTIEKHNKYEDMKFQRSFYEDERDIQYDLWTEGDFLFNCNYEQSVYLPRIIDQGINIFGEYTNSVKEEYVSGITLADILCFEEITEKSWADLTIKIHDIISETFHIDDIEETAEMFSHRIPSKVIDDYVEEDESDFSDMIDKFALYYKEDEYEKNHYVFSETEANDWKLFYKAFLSEYSYSNDNLIYNYSCERMVHGNLHYGNIIYESLANRVCFINPRCRTWRIADKNIDYAKLYMSSFCGVNLFQNSRYAYDEENSIILPDKIVTNMLVATNALDGVVEKPETLKMLATIKAMEFAFYEDFRPDDRVALLRYLTDLKAYFR